MRSEATLLQLFVEQREDALRGGRAFGAAVLVEDVDRARFFFGFDLHPILLGLHLRVARAEKTREHAALRVFPGHVAFGIGVADEIKTVLTVAILDGEADTVER